MSNSLRSPQRNSSPTTKLPALWRQFHPKIISSRLSTAGPNTKIHVAVHRTFLSGQMMGLSKGVLGWERSRGQSSVWDSPVVLSKPLGGGGGVACWDTHGGSSQVVCKPDLLALCPPWDRPLSSTPDPAPNSKTWAHTFSTSQNLPG